LGGLPQALALKHRQPNCRRFLHRQPFHHVEHLPRQSMARRGSFGLRLWCCEPI
jgi:hypothetical protein